MSEGKSDQAISKQENWLDFDVTELQLARLFGRSPGAIRAWSTYKGLVRSKGGKFNLRNSVRWLEKHYRECAEIKIQLASLTQNQLAELLGVAKQRVSDWTVQGMPRDGENRYDVAVCLRWLPRFFDGFYRCKYDEEREKDGLKR